VFLFFGQIKSLVFAKTLNGGISTTTDVMTYANRFCLIKT